MREAPSANISWVQVLEMCVNSLMAFIFSSTISCARHHIEGIEAHSHQLPREDPAHIHSLLARAMRDVCQARGPKDRRVIQVLPLLYRFKGPPNTSQ